MSDLENYERSMLSVEQSEVITIPVEEYLEFHSGSRELYKLLKSEKFKQIALMVEGSRHSNGEAYDLMTVLQLTAAEMASTAVNYLRSPYCAIVDSEENPIWVFDKSGLPVEGGWINQLPPEKE